MSSSAHAIKTTAGPYRWLTPGDINGCFGLMFDNLTVLSFMFGTLVFAFGYPADVVAERMIPGTALGVMFGDLVYTWMAFHLARRSGKPAVTAMPLGLDTPSTIGIVLTVLGPAFIMYQGRGLSPHDAAIATWYLGTATMIYIGIVKVVFSFAGGWVQRVVPQAGLLGSLAGIGLVLIGFLPMIDIFKLPVVGALSLGLVLYALVAGIRMPWNLPGVAGAVFLSTAVYYLLPHAWVGGGGFHAPGAALHLALDIVVQAFRTCPARHAPAVAFSFIPTVARMVWIQLSSFAAGVLGAFAANPGLQDRIRAFLPPQGLMQAFFQAPHALTRELQELPVINALGNGFIVTAMLWGAFMAHLIDRRLKLASVYLVILAGLTYFGIVHSVDPNGDMYMPARLPWNLRSIAYQFTAAYVVLAGVIVLLSFTRESHEAPPDLDMLGDHSHASSEPVGKLGTPTHFVGNPVTDPRSRSRGNG